MPSMTQTDNTEIYFICRE